MRVNIFEHSDKYELMDMINEWLDDEENNIEVKIVAQAIAPNGNIIISVWWELKPDNSPIGEVS